MNKIHNKLLFVILAFAALTFILSGMAGAAVGTTDEFDVVMEAAVANNGKVPPLGQIKAHTYTKKNGVTITGLYDILDENQDGCVACDGDDPSNDPLVVDLRSADDYAKGHIAGSINVYYRTLGDVSVINKLTSDLTAHVNDGGDNLIVSYGNTHHAKSFATYLSVQGLPVKNLNNGLAEWTKNTIAAPGRYLRCTSFDALGHGIAPDGCTTNDFPVTTADSINADTLSGEGYPAIDCIDGPVTSADLAEITRCTFDAMYGDPSGPEFRMTSAELYDLLDDNQDGVIQGPGDDLNNDPFVTSNRGTSWTSPYPIGPYYTRGHIISAIGLDWKIGTARMEVPVLDQTDFAPTDRQWVHHCWVGQSQQYGNSWYHLLGYNAVTLDWGMNGWTDDDYVRQAVIKPLKSYKSDFPIEAYADVKITPRKLKTKSMGKKGKYVTVHIQLPEGYDNTIIDTTTILLEDTLSPLTTESSVDGVTAKFDRAAVTDMLSPESNTLSVTGSSTDGKLTFIGTDSIYVMGSCH